MLSARGGSCLPASPQCGGEDVRDMSFHSRQRGACPRRCAKDGRLASSHRRGSVPGTPEMVQIGGCRQVRPVHGFSVAWLHPSRQTDF